MQRLFGRASGARDAPSAATAAPTDSTHRAGAAAKKPMSAHDTLHETQEVVEKREAHIRRLVDNEIEAAKRLTTAGNKREAIECIKRKRIHEKELERLQGQKLNLMQTEATLQSLRVTNVVNDAQQKAAAAIEREIKRSGGPDGVDKLQDRLEDLLADSADVLDASARPMGDMGALDEAELLEELDELEQLELEQELVDVTKPGQQGSSSGQTYGPVVEPKP